jgi:Ala-tRNA(Pro) deacylase
MGIARTVDHFLDQANVPFDVTDHPLSASSRETARVAHLKGKRLAKGVVVQDRRNGRFFMAVLPADRHLDLEWLKEDYQMDPVLANEWDLKSLFPDCEPGAVPPFGQAYHLTTIWDDSLDRQQELFFEAGDHQHLVHLDHEAFHQIFEHQPHGVISRQS